MALSTSVTSSPSLASSSAVAAPPARFRAVQVIRGRDDVLSSADWGRRLAGQAADGDYGELAGAHTFQWGHPSAWSEPVQAFAGRLP